MPTYPQTTPYVHDGTKYWHRCEVCGELLQTHVLWRVHMSDKHPRHPYLIDRKCDGMGGEYECDGLKKAHKAPIGLRPSGKRVGQHKTGRELVYDEMAERITRMEDIGRATGGVFWCGWQHDGDKTCMKNVIGLELPHDHNWSHALVTTCDAGHRVRWDTDRIAQPKLLDDDEDAWPDRKQVVLAELPESSTSPMKSIRMGVPHE